jgi:hypothetical protein
MARTDADTTVVGEGAGAAAVGAGVRGSFVGGIDSTMDNYPQRVFPALFRQIIST